MSTRVIAPLILGLALGCTSASLRTIQPAHNPSHVETLNVVEGEHNPNLSDEDRTRFKKTFTNAMLDAGHFHPGSDLTVEYKIVRFDEGNRAARAYVGYGLGKGEVVVDVKFTDPAQTVLAEIEVTGEVSGGLTGGDPQDAFAAAAKKAADFARYNFSKHN